MSYVYDSLNRLTSVDYGNGTVITYTYDAAGNRLTLMSGNQLDHTSPVVQITQPTGTSVYVTTNATVSLTGTASDNRGVLSVGWTNAAGGQGVAAGTSSWSAGPIGLAAGNNVITISASDAAGNVGQTQLTVVVVPGLTNNIVFQDSFSDQTIDPTKWTTSGIQVQETNLYMRVGQDATDNGGVLLSAPMPINAYGDITISRYVKVHHANQWFHGDMIINFGGLPAVGIIYSYYQWYLNASYGWADRIGTYITRNNAYFINISANNDVDGPFPVIWDEWFREKVVYSPTNGNLTLWINDSVIDTYNVGIMPPTNNPTIQFRFSAWGWYTGHEHLFNPFLVTQDSQPPYKVISVSGNLAYGTVVSGNSAQLPITITNLGNVAISINGITCPSGFSGTFSGTLEAGGATNVMVRFTPLAAGNYGGTITVNSDATAGISNVSATGTSITQYDVWKAEHFTVSERTDASISGDRANPAKDGIPNLMKYALNLNPKVASVNGLPQPATQNGYLTLTYRQNKQATDVIFTPLACGNLIDNSWSTNGLAVLSTVDSNTYWSVTVRDAVPMSSATNRFMRLKVTKP